MVNCGVLNNWFVMLRPDRWADTSFQMLSPLYRGILGWGNYFGKGKMLGKGSIRPLPSLGLTSSSISFTLQITAGNLSFVSSTCLLAFLSSSHKTSQDSSTFPRCSFLLLISSNKSLAVSIMFEICSSSRFWWKEAASFIWLTPLRSSLNFPLVSPRSLQVTFLRLKTSELLPVGRSVQMIYSFFKKPWDAGGHPFQLEHFKDANLTFPILRFCEETCWLTAERWWATSLSFSLSLSSSPWLCLHLPALTCNQMWKEATLRSRWTCGTRKRGARECWVFLSLSILGNLRNKSWSFSFQCTASANTFHCTMCSTHCTHCVHCTVRVATGVRKIIDNHFFPPYYRLIINSFLSTFIFSAYLAVKETWNPTVNPTKLSP